GGSPGPWHPPEASSPPEPPTLAPAERRGSPPPLRVAPSPPRVAPSPPRVAPGVLRLVPQQTPRLRRREERVVDAHIPAHLDAGEDLGEQFGVRAAHDGVGRRDEEAVEAGGGHLQRAQD